MSKIYALQGKGKIGKTGTINLVKDLLVKKYKLTPMQILDFFRRAKKDKKYILFNIKGKKVGTESYGDDVKRLSESLMDFEIVGCDIMFCACRKKGKTVNFLNNLKSKHTVYFTQQNIVKPAQWTQSNINMANFLIKKAGL